MSIIEKMKFGAQFIKPLVVSLVWYDGAKTNYFWLR